MTDEDIGSNRDLIALAEKLEHLSWRARVKLLEVVDPALGRAALKHVALRDQMTDGPMFAGRAMFPMPHPKRGNRYRLDRLIGSGRTSKVWAAHDRHLNRMVALKIVTRPATVARHVLLEGQRVAAVRHPNVNTVFDCGADTTPPFFLSLELLRQRDSDEPPPQLGQWLQQPDRVIVTMSDVANIVMQIARGLEAATETGARHGDVSLTNILIDPLTLKAWLIDFGALDDEGLSSESSPERRSRKLQPSDACEDWEKSDVYSLGHVLNTLLEIHRFPSRRLQSLVKWSTQESPGDRPTARELGDALESWLSLKPTWGDGPLMVLLLFLTRRVMLVVNLILLSFGVFQINRNADLRNKGQMLEASLADAGAQRHLLTSSNASLAEEREWLRKEVAAFKEQVDAGQRQSQELMSRILDRDLTIRAANFSWRVCIAEVRKAETFGRDATALATTLAEDARVEQAGSSNFLSSCFDEVIELEHSLSEVRQSEEELRESMLTAQGAFEDVSDKLERCEEAKTEALSGESSE